MAGTTSYVVMNLLFLSLTGFESWGGFQLTKLDTMDVVVYDGISLNRMTSNLVLVKLGAL